MGIVETETARLFDMAAAAMKKESYGYSLGVVAAFYPCVQSGI